MALEEGTFGEVVVVGGWVVGTRERLWLGVTELATTGV